MNRKRMRGALLAAVLLMMIGISACLIRDESTYCMGIPILTEEEIAEYTQYIYTDLSEKIRFNDQQAAIDIETSTIYVSAEIKDRKEEIKGNLSISDDGISMYFMPDPAFEQMKVSVGNGHAFSLIVDLPDDRYMKYNVIFSSLPILSIQGAFSHRDEEDREVFRGNLLLWNANDPALGRYSVQNSPLEWHIRGHTSAGLRKKPWKLSLKNEWGEIQDKALCGLGEDDDWNLNPMIIDDTKMRECLFISLWNQLVERDGYSYPMAKGEYVEVLINGHYEGLYMLQRRLDAKYLELDDDQILVRGIRIPEGTAARDVFEIVASNYSEQETYQMLEAFANFQCMEKVDVDNFLDINLFIQWALAGDNTSYNNTFFVFSPDQQEDAWKIIPWDTDISMGVMASDHFYINLDHREIDVHRIETYQMNIHHMGLEEKIAERWNNLRQSILSLDNINEQIEHCENKLNESGSKQRDEQIEHCENKLNESGSKQRDEQRWGLIYQGEDSVDVLKTYFESRAVWMDEHYLVN